jgi:hypothetical protein
MSNKYQKNHQITISLILIVILILMFSNLTIAIPISKNHQDLELDCKAQILESKSFVAKTSEINIGLWCANNAYIRLYECSSPDATCQSPNYLLTANKVSGVLADISNFEVGNKYLYQCYECPVAPNLELDYQTLSIDEGERLELRASCVDNKGRVGSIKFTGWMKSNIKLTNFDDAGEYSSKVTCSDQNDLTTTEEIIVTVNDVNRAPKIHAVLKN